jgi:hypothetical protein
MNYSFKQLWNRAFLFIGPGWYLLVWMIWSSGQLVTVADKMTFIGIVIPGFLIVYTSGFFIERWHHKKKTARS